MLTRGLFGSNEILWLRGGVMMMKAIIFDAFGTLFKVTNGGSAKTIMKNITACGVNIDEKEFLEEWKNYYKKCCP